MVHFRFTDRYGNCAVPVKMVFVNDNENRCIFPVYLVGILAWFYQKICWMCSPVEHYSGFLCNFPSL